MKTEVLTAAELAARKFAQPETDTRKAELRAAINAKAAELAAVEAAEAEARQRRAELESAVASIKETLARAETGLKIDAARAVELEGQAVWRWANGQMAGDHISEYLRRAFFVERAPKFIAETKAKLADAERELAAFIS